MRTQRIFDTVMNALAAMLRGIGLLVMDFHHWAHHRWGDRVYGYYAIGGIFFLLLVSGALWALIHAVAQALVWLLLIVIIAGVLIAMAKGAFGGGSGRRR